MDRTMRLFLAITLDDDLRAQLALRALELTTQLNSPVRAWSATGAASLHVTLKFLGETQTPPEVIEQAVRPAVGSQSAFQMVVSGVGAFPSAVRARVLWAGVREGHDELVRLAEEIERACSTLGFEPERRPFSGHITLGRTRHNIRHASALPVVQAEPPQMFGEMLVREVTLYRSELGKGGAKHTALCRMPLISAAS